jgi:hypothetical protein
VKALRIAAAGVALIAGMTLLSVATGSPADCTPSSAAAITAERQAYQAPPRATNAVAGIAQEVQGIAFESGLLGRRLADFASKLAHQTCW